MRRSLENINPTVCWNIFSRSRGSLLTVGFIFSGVIING